MFCDWKLYCPILFSQFVFSEIFFLTALGVDGLGWTQWWAPLAHWFYQSWCAKAGGRRGRMAGQISSFWKMSFGEGAVGGISHPSTLRPAHFDWSQWSEKKWEWILFELVGKRKTFFEQTKSLILFNSLVKYEREKGEERRMVVWSRSIVLF